MHKALSNHCCSLVSIPIVFTNKYFCLFFVPLTLLPGCGSKQSASLSDKESGYAQGEKERIPQLTVWIHGTTSNPFFKKLHMSPLGMRLASSLPSSYHLKKSISYLCDKDPLHFDCQHFYTFGWSGKLSPHERRAVAQDLYGDLDLLIKEYQERYGVMPYVRIITHSHGGNVALNLARVPHKSFRVDELIMLACPVQNSTKDLIKDPVFKNIYSIYSDFDLLQVLDPQILQKDVSDTDTKKKKVFSQRAFPPQKNLRQARIKIKGRAPFHAEFVMRYFVERLPEILEIMATKEGNRKPYLIKF